MTLGAETGSLSSDIPQSGVLLGRVAIANQDHPSVVTVRDGWVIDITNSTAPTIRDIIEFSNPSEYVRTAPGTPLVIIEDLLRNSLAGRRSFPRLLAPIDLQAVKASGVTFISSLLERVIEEQAQGNPDQSETLRREIVLLIGDDLSKVEPGSVAAAEVKQALLEKGAWSQYLEVGIGPDAEIFTKAQPLSAVGYGADVGILEASSWNNPEPEIVLIISSEGKICGATLGNDVNLRDIEGRSALLLGKAKDNNASTALGPFLRLFDAEFTLDKIKFLDLDLVVEGNDGFVLRGSSSMSQISRAPEALAAATIGKHHQYPDGLALFLGTMFAPTADRDGVGKGFTHKIGDKVTISTPMLGALRNTVQISQDCEPWTCGTSHLMRSLAKVGLLASDLR